jgi:hypothetical protein
MVRRRQLMLQKREEIAREWQDIKMFDMQN